jgi:isopenicillin N synthase-like dioxygenase
MAALAAQEYGFCESGCGFGGGVGAGCAGADGGCGRGGSGGSCGSGSLGSPGGTANGWVGSSIHPPSNHVARLLRFRQLRHTLGVDGLPVIDVSPLLRSDAGGRGAEQVAEEIDAACRDTGFFYAVGHDVSSELVARLDRLAREFFALDDHEKSAIAMHHGGSAWRGWFPVGGELTSGKPDMKEGIYFGDELGPADPRVEAGLPLHGPNLFPVRPEGLGAAVLEYIDSVTALGHALLRGMSVGLGLDESWFDRHLTAEPLVLFRIFHYPPLESVDERWSVGEHTDYGLITILAQDASGGLEVRGPRGWIAAPPIADAFVVNLGDMLERMTGGRYRSTPHRVRNASGLDRVSFPLFLDPAWTAEVLPVPLAGGEVSEDRGERWDGADVHAWSGTYGEYVVAKVGRVFPALRDAVLPTTE